MRKYVKDTYTMFPDNLGGNVSLPTAKHLMEVNSEAEKLDEKVAQTFHTITARILFVGKQTRPDILLTVSFLCTRVKGPDIDNWKKI